MLLRAENIIKNYGEKKIVKGVSFYVEQGEIVGLLGPNGAGKTTSFYMVVGLIKPTQGQVFLDNQEITKDAMYKRAQKGIGYLAQEASVFRKLSVEDNILGVLQYTDLSKKEQKYKTDQLIEEFSLEHVRHNRGDLLSGGERRRTEIARCLAVDPAFILLDEPFAGVDPIAVEDIQKIVRSLVDKNIGILITDHNVQQTLAITNRTYIMFEGKILKEGEPLELANDEMVRKVYLGENFTFQEIDTSQKIKSQKIIIIWFATFDNSTYFKDFINNEFNDYFKIKYKRIESQFYHNQEELDYFIHASKNHLLNIASNLNNFYDTAIQYNSIITVETSAKHVKEFEEFMNYKKHSIDHDKLVYFETLYDEG